MKITTVLFDLDGTLLPMDQDIFVKAYFKGLAAKLAPYGYEPKALIDAIWKGTTAMIRNDGSRKNEDAFWAVFTDIFGLRALDDLPKFDEFYRTDFQKVQASCGFNTAARETIGLVKALGMNAVLATNPIFPAIATQSRIRWAGLCPEDFQLYTTYENSNYCKPNPDYYREILSKLNLTPEECVMVGNDAIEDTAALDAGIPSVFLLTDCLINKDNRDISTYPHGGFPELHTYIQELNA